ncbi:penicillin-binding transpeptidase domain-containing protein [Candidatus Latescibacterota bacterium]
MFKISAADYLQTARNTIYTLLGHLMLARPHIIRLRFVTIMMVILWLVLWVRIGIIQGIRHERYSERAISQRIKPVILRANRGNILDRNGVPLAINLPSASYGMRPEEITDVEKAARVLSQAVDMNVMSVTKVLTSNKKFVWLVRHAEPLVIRAIDSADIMGVHKLQEFRRYYPLGIIGSQVIGYTDIDGRGIEGCELYVNDNLSGWDGRSKVFRDALGRAALSLDDPDIEPQDGLDVVLTIDWRIQEIADEEVEKSVVGLNAVWGGVIVINADTGEILAMSNTPRFNPNDLSNFDPKVFDPNNRRNRLVTDMLEPGSTFKIVTFAEALESGVVYEDDLIDCENGKFRVANHTINDSHKLGIVPVSDVFIHSSNIGSVKIAEKIGKHRLYERARLMGFGTATGIDVPDETKGSLPNPRTWSKLSLPTISFGQGVAVSPIQLAMAYCAVANGGFLMRPYIIKEVKDKGTRSGRITNPQKIRRTMKTETARRLTELLSLGVEYGTGKEAAIPNICVAGKTGTAQRPREGKKGYESGRYVSSFIGFIVDRDPRILCLVMIDSPKGLYYGSQVAAPACKNILNRILNISKGPWSPVMVEKDDEKGKKEGLVPGLKGMSIHAAVAKLREFGFSTSVVGDSSNVLNQLPRPGAKLNRGDDITLYSNIMTTEKSNFIKVPELRGKTVREAVQYLVQAQLKVNIQGSGIVSNQSPPAGSLVKHGTVCKIACKKR